MDYNDKNLYEKLKKEQEECARLREENARLRKLLGISSEEEILNQKDQAGENIEKNYSKAQLSDGKALVTNNSSSKEKVAFFRQLFRAREAVYAVRWENKKGKNGYSPACKHE